MYTFRILCIHKNGKNTLHTYFTHSHSARRKCGRVVLVRNTKHDEPRRVIDHSPCKKLAEHNSLRGCAQLFACMCYTNCISNKKKIHIRVLLFTAPRIQLTKNPFSHNKFHKGCAVQGAAEGWCGGAHKCVHREVCAVCAWKNCIMDENKNI